MKLQKQLIKHDPENGQFGDCFRTCVAVIMGMDASDVPHFCDYIEARPKDHPENRHNRLSRWLAQFGLAPSFVAYVGDVYDLEDAMYYTSGQSPGVPMILTGQSETGCNHSVVILDQKIVCDPAGTSIVGPTLENIWEVMTISVSAKWTNWCGEHKPKDTSHDG